MFFFRNLQKATDIRKDNNTSPTLEIILLDKTSLNASRKKMIHLKLWHLIQKSLFCSFTTFSYCIDEKDCCFLLKFFISFCSVTKNIISCTLQSRETCCSQKMILAYKLNLIFWWIILTIMYTIGKWKTVRSILHSFV